MQIVFLLIILIFSSIIHEYMHGWMADRLGDPTAKNAGRLTLNPIPHIDPVMTIFVPILFYLSTNMVFGGAKPVPFNPYNLRDSRYGPAWVAFAGPLGNFIIALIFGLALRFFTPILYVYNLAGIFSLIVIINLLLMVFNLVPIPPLDGSKIIAPFLPVKFQIRMAEMERYGMIFVMAFVLIGFPYIYPIIGFLYSLITGA